MKKLLIMASAVLVVGVASAASMTWGTGVMYKPNTAANGAFSSTRAGKTVTAYYFALTVETYASLYVADNYAASAEKVFAKYATKSADGKTFSVSSATESGTTATTSHARNFTDAKTYNAGETAYAAMILKWTDSTSGTDYYIANIGSYNFEVDTDGKVATFGTNQFGDGAALAGWTAVPEPTSGLLMLLGMAGLALRRKRA